jgi:leucyl-tRNA synthetase
MTTSYNHKEIEQKWRMLWEEQPINLETPEKEKY